MFAHVGYSLCVFSTLDRKWDQQLCLSATIKLFSFLPTVILDEFKKLETEIFLLCYEPERKRQVSPVSSIVQFNGFLVKNLNICFEPVALATKAQ